MPIPESQLETWASQGSIQQSSTTYAAIKKTLNAPDVGYADKTYDIFLHGSYSNDTNVYSESDVDIVIRQDSIFYYDTSALPADQLATFHSTLSEGTYPYSTFKSHVVSALTKGFGSAVTVGNKAVTIASAANRRKADVLVSAQFRRYDSYSPYTGGQYTTGLCFFTTSGVRIVNYPKQHNANCTLKHQTTGEWFKPIVRIFKNARSRLITEGLLTREGAPSYFIEGMLYNVPTSAFGANYAETMVACLNWLYSADKNTLLCANEQFYLVRAGVTNCWDPSNYDRALAAFIRLWNDW